MAETTQIPSASNTPSSKRRRPWLPALASFVLASFLAISLQIIFFSPISPQTLQLPSSKNLKLSIPVSNKKLQEVTKLGEGFLKDPEDICVDEKTGILYTSNRDGWIKRLHPNGSWENWKNIYSQTLLGITNSKQGGIIVCDAQKGLLKVNEDGFSTLVAAASSSSSHGIDRISISFADDVIEGEDGSLYFSDASSKFGLHNWYLDFLEAKPNGQLLKYDPFSKQLSVLLNNLYFPNGVALSSDQHYLVVCETFKFRCLKYWLKGEKEGKTEIFVENLPGGPDNINLAPDGSFWIALIQLYRDGYETMVSWKVMRRIMATFPKMVNVMSDGHKKAMVVNVGSYDGKIITKLEDPDGMVMSFVTTALEVDHHLYLGSLNSNFIGKFPLLN